jgi:hypothetical protein
MNQPYTVAHASGDEILPIVDKINKAIDGESFPNATMALLYTVFTIACPDISDDDLAKGIKDSSEHICMLLDSFEHPIEGMDKLKFN